jgi:hypothetical protein
MAGPMLFGGAAGISAGLVSAGDGCCAGAACSGLAPEGGESGAVPPPHAAIVHDDTRSATNTGLRMRLIIT